MKFFSLVTLVAVAVSLSGCAAAKAPAKVVYVGGLPSEDDMQMSNLALGEEDPEISYHAPSKWTTARDEVLGAIVSLRPNTSKDDGLKRITVTRLGLGLPEAMDSRLKEQEGAGCETLSAGRSDDEDRASMKFLCPSSSLVLSTIRLIDGKTYEVVAKWPLNWTESQDDYEILANSLSSKRLKQAAKEDAEQKERLEEKARREREARETAPDGRHIFQMSDFTYLRPEGWIVEEDDSAAKAIKAYPAGDRDGDRQIHVNRYNIFKTPSEIVQERKSDAISNGCRTAYAGEIGQTKAYQLAVMCHEEKTYMFIVRVMGRHTYEIMGSWPYGEERTDRLMRQFVKDIHPKSLPASEPAQTTQDNEEEVEAGYGLSDEDYERLCEEYPEACM